MESKNKKKEKEIVHITTYITSSTCYIHLALWYLVHELYRADPAGQTRTRMSRAVCTGPTTDLHHETVRVVNRHELSNSSYLSALNSYPKTGLYR